MNPSSLRDVHAIAARMAASPADAVALARQLQDAIARLPPDHGQLMSRPVFDRASLFTLAASFELVEATDEAPLAVIRCPSDLWIRGVSCQVYPQVIPDAEGATTDLLEAVQMYRDLCSTLGSNHRGLVRLNWRVNSRQGFVSAGARGERLAPATIITGDGYYSAPLDWRLQRNDTIEVRLQSRMLEVFGVGGFNAFTPTQLEQLRTLRWCVVAFWAEELTQPST